MKENLKAAAESRFSLYALLGATKKTRGVAKQKKSKK